MEFSADADCDTDINGHPGTADRYAGTADGHPGTTNEDAGVRNEHAGAADGHTHGDANRDDRTVREHDQPKLRRIVTAATAQWL